MSIINYITALGHRLVLWAAARYATVGTVPQLLLVDLAYREIERKAQRVAEVKEMISELEDTRVTLRASGDHIKSLLYTQYKESKYELLNQLLAEHLVLDALMAQAAEALVAANEDYVATIEEARERLGIEVYE